MVGGAFRGHRWFLGYSTAACIAAISLACSNLVTNFKALSALFVAIGVTTAFNETGYMLCFNYIIFINTGICIH